MKKSLLAIAAMTAFAGAAQAQSSVSVYGIIDAGYIGGNTRLNSSAGTAANGYQNGTKETTVNQFGESAEQSSRLGFKGTEDLGGGAQALFTYEIYMYPQDSNLAGNANAGLYNRQSFVGLHKNGVGQATVGLQYTPVFNAQAVTDAGQNNNITGDLIFATGPSTDSQNQGTVSSMTQRTANTVYLKSDSFAGFTGTAMMTMNNSNATQTGSTVGGNTNASGWGLAADYTWKKLYVTGAYQALKQLTTSSDLLGANAVPWTSPQPAVSPATNANSTAATNGLNVQDNQGYVGATYDFGILKAYAQYITRTATATANTGYYAKRSAEQIGVRSFITPSIEGWASAGLGRYTAFGEGAPTANMNAWQLGSNYWLSKRTNLYAIVGSQNITNAATTTTTASGATNGYALGLRHTF